MIRMRRKLACCTKDSKISIDLDEQERIMTYNGLESCMDGDRTCETESKTSRRYESASNSLDEDNSSCSSSKDVFGSFSSKWIAVKRDPDELYEWEMIQSPQHFHVKEKPSYVMMELSDIDTMKEKFAKLLLGEDIKGGCNGVSTALALSNAITNLAASVFGELWKLEPLPEEKKRKWRQELEWFLSPTNYMVELVPAKQHGANGRTLEIMTPKARADIHMNLPALQKLDSMLIETLDSMVSTEFWYGEGGSRADGRSRSKRWWLPSPQVPKSGLSVKQRKKLVFQGNVVHQVFKAASSINASVLFEMPVPTIIGDALPKHRKLYLGTELYKVLTSESSSIEMLNCLNLKTEHDALDIVNKLEAAIFLWKAKKTQEQSSGKSPVRTSWPFVKDPMSVESLLHQAEALIHHIKITYPNLPHSFLDVTKIQYGKDIGHAILEAYSRVLSNLAFRILCRIGDILQEDERSNPDSPVKACCFRGINLVEAPIVDSHAKHSLAGAMDSVDDGQLLATPNRSLVCCIGREACGGMSTRNSP